MVEQIKLVKSFKSYMMSIKSSMAIAIKNSRMSRAHIAEKMNELMVRDDGDGPITTAQIDSWTKNEEKRTAFVKYLPIFCYVVQDYTPLQEFISSIGLKIVGSREQLLMDLGESELRRLEAAKDRKKALEGLGAPEESHE